MGIALLARLSIQCLAQPPERDSLAFRGLFVAVALGRIYAHIKSNFKLYAGSIWHRFWVQC